MIYTTCYNESVKNNKEKECYNMTIAFWFLQDLYIKGEITQREFVIIETAYHQEILTETEKANYVKFLSELGSHEMWIPKKCFREKSYKRVTVIVPKWLARTK